MDSTADAAAARVGLTRDDLARALASYVRSILSGDSPVRSFTYGDRVGAVGRAAARPARLSRQRQSARPATWARRSPTSSSTTPASPGTTDVVGCWPFRRAGLEIDGGAFKTPTLREVARTAPYMHDGSLATLEDVIDFYDRGGRPNPHLDKEIRPLHLTDSEKQALIAFLRALSGDVLHGARQ